MSRIVVPLNLFEYDKTRKQLKIASEYFGMPAEFDVTSHHTGQTVKFIPIGPDHRLFDQDGWDGEQQIYEPVTPVPNVDVCIVYNQW